MVVVLIAVLMLGILALTTFRRSTSRNLAGMVYRLEAVSFAEAAIAEVAHPAFLVQIFSDGGGRDALATALRTGRREGSAVYPAAMDLRVDAERLQAALGDGSSLRVGEVRIQPLVYYPGAGSQKGLMRFSVEVTREAAGRVTRVTVAEDYEFTMFREGMDRLRFMVALSPTRRLLS